MQFNFDYVRRLISELTHTSNKDQQQNIIAKASNEVSQISTQEQEMLKVAGIEIFSSGEAFESGLQNGLGIDTSVFAKSIAEIKELDLSGDKVHLGAQDSNDDNWEFYQTMDKLYSNQTFKNMLDLDEDGILSNEEAQSFFNAIKSNDGEKNDISIDDITSVINEANQYLNAMQDVGSTNQEQGLGSLFNQESTSSPYESILKGMSDFVSQSSGGNYAQSGTAAGSLGSAQSSGSYQATPAQQISENILSSANLEEQKAQLEEELEDYKQEEAQIRQGEQEIVKNAISEKDEAQKAMDEKIKEDEKISEEQKQQLEQFETDIAAKDEEISQADSNITAKKDEISQNDSDISQCESDISSTESEISSIDSQISSLPSSSGDEEQDQQIQEQKQELESKKQDAENKLEEQKGKLEELESKKETLEADLAELEENKASLEEQKQGLVEQRNELLTQMQEQCSPETKAAIEAFKQAEANVETVKNDETQKVESNIQTTQANLDNVVEQIEEQKEIAQQLGISADGEKLAQLFNEKFKGALEGKGADIVAAAEKYDLDPALLAAIMATETGWGTSNAIVNKNNPGGMMDPATNWMKLKTYSTLEEGVDAMASNLKRNYIDQGLTTIPQIANKYCPVGAANDPTGMNSNWPSVVSDIYNGFIEQA